MSTRARQWVRSVAGLLAVCVIMTGAAAAVAAADPKAPPGHDPGGLAIALIGGGIDYTSPKLMPRLARDGEGELIGFDAVDNDHLPFAAPPVATPNAEGGGVVLAARSDNMNELAEIMLSAYARSRLVPIRVPQGNPQALAQAIAFAVGTPARIIAIADPLASEPLRMVVQQASERFRDHLFVVAGQMPRAADKSAKTGEAAKVPGPLMNLRNVLVVLSAAEVEGRSASDVISASELVVMPRGSTMFGFAQPGAAPRDGREAVALAAASAACQNHGIETQLLGSAAKAAAIDAGSPLTDNRAIRVLDPMCWYGGKRM